MSKEYSGTPFEEFISPEFGKVTIVMVNNEPWFIGKEIARILGYVNPSKALIDHVKDHNKLNNDSLLSLGQRGGWLINEAGLYTLIFGSKLENAEVFQDWVTNEVLPSIRNNGHYVEPTPDDWSNLTPKQLKLRHEHAMKLMKQAYDDLDNMDSYARFGYTVAMREGDITVEQFSKLMADEFKIGRNRMYQFLREQGYLLDVKVYYKWNMPRQSELEAGRMSILPIADRGEKIYMLPMITLKGAKFYHDKLEEALGRKHEIKTDSKDPTLLNLSAANEVDMDDGFIHLKPKPLYFEIRKHLDKN